MGCSCCLAARGAAEWVVAPVTAEGKWWCSCCTCEMYECTPVQIASCSTDDNDCCLIDFRSVCWLLIDQLQHLKSSLTKPLRQLQFGIWRTPCKGQLVTDRNATSVPACSPCAPATVTSIKSLILQNLSCCLVRSWCSFYLGPFNPWFPDRQLQGLILLMSQYRHWIEIL